jgi:hypothetical protein
LLWRKSKSEKDMVRYKKLKQQCKKIIAHAKKEKNHEMVESLGSAEGKKNVWHIAKQMIKQRQDVVQVNCLKSEGNSVVTGDEGVKKIWKKYMKHLFNEENVWDNVITSPLIEGPKVYY